MKTGNCLSAVVKFGLLGCTFLLSQCALLGALPGDEHWDKQFGPVGANDVLQAVAASGQKVFIGGSFKAAGNAKANLVAGFDGTNWLGLNNGISTSSSFFMVLALAVAGNDLYAGGWFTDADGSGARYIARWDGTNWFRLGGGLNSIVQVIKPIGTNIYAGGLFSTSAVTAVNGIARWDGSNWFALGGGITGGSFPAVTAVDSDGTYLYAGGTFTQAGGLDATNVARWNGVTWSPMGTGLNGSVRAFAVHGGSLYAGGSFTNGSLAMTNLARWDGNNWSAVGLGANRTVWDLVSDGANLYAGGNFTAVDGVAASGVARWDGNNWSPLGAGLGGFGIGSTPSGAYKLAWSSNRLYVAGVFNFAGGVGASHVAGWDGTNWFALGGGKSKGLTHFTGNVFGFLPSGTNLYAGGTFTEAGDVIANSIAKWNGASWSALGSGLKGTFTSGVAPNGRAIASITGNLYVGGNFTNAGGIVAKGIARWDGANWFPLDTGADATVRALAANGTDLYVGGSFTNAGGILSPGIARWTGSGWLTMAGGVAGGSRSVSAVVADGLNIYIGGNFTSVGGVNATNIARWDGGQWNALANGVNGTVSAIAISNGVLYAGGSFSFADTSVNRIAKWNGASWSALGSGLSGDAASVSVSALALRGTDLYVGGNFTNAGGVYATGVAKWDGTSWSALGSGLTTSPGTPIASALAVPGNDLYVGGGFIWAGDKPSMFIARWNDQLNFYPPPQPRLINQTWLTNGQFRFRLAGTSGERYTIQATTNMSAWTPLLTNSTPLFDFTDSTASTFSIRAYRAAIE